MLEENAGTIAMAPRFTGHVENWMCRINAERGESHWWMMSSVVSAALGVYVRLRLDGSDCGIYDLFLKLDILVFWQGR
jgi:hypothetical protein